MVLIEKGTFGVAVEKGSADGVVATTMESNGRSAVVTGGDGTPGAVEGT